MITRFEQCCWLFVAAAFAAAASLAATPIHAQTSQPSTSPATAACPLAPGAPPPSSLPAPPDPKQLAQQLATALNLPLATVQQALATESSQMAPALLPPPADPIAGAATQLGVSEQQLMTAVQSADQSLGPVFSATGGAGGGNAVFAAAGGPSGGGPVFFQSGGQGGSGPSGAPGAPAFAIGCGTPAGGPNIDPTTFFADVAQQLGPGFAGSQVQAAFEASAPTPPDPGTVQSLLQKQMSSLAAALGVTDDALTSALSSIGYPNGCLPLFVGGNVSVKPPFPPPGSGNSGPIFIPLGRSGTGQRAVAFSNGPVGGSAAVVSGPGTGAGVMCVIGTGTSGQLTPDGS